MKVDFLQSDEAWRMGYEKLFLVKNFALSIQYLGCQIAWRGIGD
jgi:hypothetical protein